MCFYLVWVSVVAELLALYSEKSIWLISLLFSAFKVYYTSLYRQVSTPADNLLRILKQPIFNKIWLVTFHLCYNKAKRFLQKRVCMTLICCSLLPMAIIAKCSPQTDDAKHQHFSVTMWINLNIWTFVILLHIKVAKCICDPCCHLAAGLS